MQTPHKERAHSKFSASGAERWLKCAASVALEELAPPSKDNVWSVEGTLAHEVLEKFLLNTNWQMVEIELKKNPDVNSEMISHCKKAATYIIKEQSKFNAKLFVEKKVFNSFIHEEMFGTCDAVVVEDGGTLQIIDFKYGAGHVVDPKENPQLIQYALAVAEWYDWKFNRVSMTILQPRAGANWHRTWTITIKELKDFWRPLWVKGVARVESGNAKPYPGSWCHWCRAKNFNCEESKIKRNEKIAARFGPAERTDNCGKEKSEKENSEESFEAFETEKETREESGEENFDNW